MTEDEAKSKWCPMVRFVPSTEEHHSATNRGDSITREADVSVNCIGSACMAWRWNEDWVSSVHDPVAKTLTYKLKGGAREQGGCGLAGAPQ